MTPLLFCATQAAGPSAHTFADLALCAQLFNIIDVFLVFCESFLPDASTLDTLFYELVRRADTVKTLAALGCSLHPCKRGVAAISIRAEERAVGGVLFELVMWR